MINKVEHEVAPDGSIHTFKVGWSLRRKHDAIEMKLVEETALRLIVGEIRKAEIIPITENDNLMNDTVEGMMTVMVIDVDKATKYVLTPAPPTFEDVARCPIDELGICGGCEKFANQTCEKRALGKKGCGDFEDMNLED